MRLTASNFPPSASARGHYATKKPPKTTGNIEALDIRAFTLGALHLGLAFRAAQLRFIKLGFALTTFVFLHWHIEHTNTLDILCQYRELNHLILIDIVGLRVP